ncbi:MAG: signal peptidase II [Deltaproteobacteria bacterium]|jgi:signal peptidase II|nr:signal peptidase II [Deltaproteobacteria bacterium]
MLKKYGVPAALAALVLLLDQLSKAAVEAGIPLNRSLPVLDGFFNLVHVRNRGAAFGFLNRGDISWQFWLFTGFTLLAVILILFLIRKTRRPGLLSLSAFGAILGGALGNFIDRLRFRYVTDFLDFYLGNFHWPAFNVADMALCYGVVIFALSGFSGKAEA